jgi:hypothetical protein
MSTCRLEAENGLNAFIEEQKKQTGEALLTLVQFDTEYQFVHRGEPIQQVPHFTLVPRGMTALLDAVGRCINETGVRIDNMPEDQRPGLVVFVILTDGQENSSHEFTKAQIKSMIEHQQSVYNWQFTYLGANQDAFTEAAALGISANATANYATVNTAQAFAGASGNVTRMRHSTGSGQSVSNAYTAEELEKMTGK